MSNAYRFVTARFVRHANIAPRDVSWGETRHIDLGYELRPIDWKVKAAAEYATTQLVFDVRVLEHFLTRMKT